MMRRPQLCGVDHWVQNERRRNPLTSLDVGCQRRSSRAPHNPASFSQGGTMLEHHLKSPVTRQRLRSGPIADHVDGFADWLHRGGYKPASIDSILRSLAGWADWMQSAGFTVHDCLAWH